MSSGKQRLDRDPTVYPSARRLLEAGFSCKQPNVKRGWAIYWMEGGSELTLFPGDEGPQEASSIDEIIDWIGGDQPAMLTPAAYRYFDDVKQTVLDALKEEGNHA